MDEKKIREDETVNLTDPDANLMKFRDGGIGPGYNCQAAVDSKHESLTGAMVSECASDHNLAVPMIEGIQQHRQAKNQDTKYTLDAGYFSSGNLQYGEDKGLESGGQFSRGIFLMMPHCSPLC